MQQRIAIVGCLCQQDAAKAIAMLNGELAAVNRIF
jgi:hypothetical protein